MGNLGGKDHVKGHRARLRARFLKGGPDALADYELLELLLFLGIPRRDVKPLAKSLIDEFGSLAAVLSAAPEKLSGHLGESAVAAVKIVQAAALHLGRSEVLGRTVLGNWDAVQKYLQSAMARMQREQFRLLFLDRKNVLIADEILSDGTIDHTAVYPREIIRRALELDAGALILVHNHPSGDPTPSRTDVTMTKEIRDACQKIGIDVHDHIVVGKEGQASFRKLGLL